MVCQKSLLGNIHHLVSSKSIDLIWVLSDPWAPTTYFQQIEIIALQLPGVVCVDIPGSNSDSAKPVG